MAARGMGVGLVLCSSVALFNLVRFQLTSPLRGASELAVVHEPSPIRGLRSISMKVSHDDCMDPIRLGRSGDGGWWACGKLSTPCTVYSFGIFDSFSFDQAVADKGCKVHGFDPSKPGLKSKPAYERIHGATYHEFGIGGVDRKYGPGEVPFSWPGIGYLTETNSDPWQLYTLPSIMKKNNHDHLSILKVDVEGSEWAAMEGILSSSWDQLLVEFHFHPAQFKLIKEGNGVSIESSEESPMLELVEKLVTIATLWKLDWNGNQCLELSWIRKT